MDCCCLQCIREDQYGVQQYCGAHEKMMPAGCHCICFPFQTVFKRQSFRTMMTEVLVSSKSKDNTTVDAKIAIQYAVHQSREGDPTDDVSDHLWKAVYTLSDVDTTIQGYVEDVVRSILPRMDLDEVFSGKDDINVGVKEQLQEKLKQYGYDITSVLLVHIGIAPNVAASMNEINASARLREAAKEKADAEKILSVKSAEADAEAKYLLGAGVANQRKAIIEGLKKTVTDFNADVEGTSPRDVMDLLLMTQYFEMVKVGMLLFQWRYTDDDDTSKYSHKLTICTLSPHTIPLALSRMSAWATTPLLLFSYLTDLNLSTI